MQIITLSVHDDLPILATRLSESCHVITQGVVSVIVKETKEQCDEQVRVARQAATEQEERAQRSAQQSVVLASKHESDVNDIGELLGKIKGTKVRSTM